MAKYISKKLEMTVDRMLKPSCELSGDVMLNWYVTDENDQVFEKVLKLGNYYYRPLYCAVTGKVLMKSDLEYGGSVPRINVYGEYISEEAAEDLSRCDNCGRYFDLSSEGIYTRDDMVYCEECMDDCVIRCTECGEAYSSDWWDYHGTVGEDTCGDEIHLCNSCEDDYTTCYDCGCLVHVDYAYYDDDWGNAYCELCWDEHHANKTLVNSYHDGFEVEHINDDRYNKLSTGIEVEVEVDYGNGDADDDDKVQPVIDSLGDLFGTVEHDGSLCNGVEYITQPASLENFDLEDFEDALNYSDYEASHRCGLHVHMDKRFFEDSTLRRKYGSEEIEEALFVVLKNNCDWFVKFAGRTPNHHCEINGGNDGEKLFTEAKTHEKWRDVSKRDRYQALNFSNSETIEIRMFAGTTSAERIYTVLEFVNIYAKLVKNCKSLADAVIIRYEDFKEEATRAGYENFKKWAEKYEKEAA